MDGCIGLSALNFKRELTANVGPGIYIGTGTRKMLSKPSTSTRRPHVVMERNAVALQAWTFIHRSFVLETFLRFSCGSFRCSSLSARLLPCEDPHPFLGCRYGVFQS